MVIRLLSRDRVQRRRQLRHLLQGVVVHHGEPQHAMRRIDTKSIHATIAVEMAVAYADTALGQL